LELWPGQAGIITGPSGSGKSTLLRALVGCLPEGGTTSWNALFLPDRPALVLQDPEAQLLCTTVEEEVSQGVRNQGLDADTATCRVNEALSALGLSASREQNLEALSTGQKQRIVLAALLAMHPSLLLLDEPFSQLDAKGAAQLRNLISRQRAEGRAVLVSAHHAEPDDGLWDLRLDLPSSCTHGISPRIPEFALPSGGHADGNEPALRAEGITYRTDQGTLVLDGLCLSLAKGSTVHIMADNASGKTTLIRCLVKALALEGGRLVVDGIDSPELGDLVGRVGYLPQNADMLLFEESVEREVAFTLRRRVSVAAVRRQRLNEILALCGLSTLAARSPLCLSHGERHMVALASVIASHPAVLLLDEPLTGLDNFLATSVLGILNYCARVQSMAVLLVSHAQLPMAWGDRHLGLREGRLYEE
jgi:energy-coupling factor transport system ATP-binding protein